MNFLRHIIPDRGIIANLAKIEAMLNWEHTKIVMEIQSILGLTRYYQRFRERFPTIASLFTLLTCKGVRFRWDRDVE